jgi:hypothetical protein
MATYPAHLPNSVFIQRKIQLMDLGFSHKEAKLLLKYISKYHVYILKYDSVLFAAIFYCSYMFFIVNNEKRMKKGLVYKILNKWKNKKNHKAKYADYFYLYDKLSLFGKCVESREHIREGIEELEIDEFSISKMLLIYYYEKQSEDDDMVIFKRIIDNYSHLFYSSLHRLRFLLKIEDFVRTKYNWSMFLTVHNDVRNIDCQLPQELLDSVQRKLFTT